MNKKGQAQILAFITQFWQLWVVLIVISALIPVFNSWNQDYKAEWEQCKAEKKLLESTNTGLTKQVTDINNIAIEYRDIAQDCKAELNETKEDFAEKSKKFVTPFIVVFGIKVETNIFIIISFTIVFGITLIFKLFEFKITMYIPESWEEKLNKYEKLSHLIDIVIQTSFIVICIWGVMLLIKLGGWYG